MIKIKSIILPNEPLSNFQLMDAVKDLKIKNFRGVFLRDQLPKKPKKKECGIINLADSDDSQGTHWVAYYKDSDNDLKVYFDSYGIQPPLELIAYLKDPIYYSREQVQPNNTVVCGHLCLRFLSKLK